MGADEGILVSDRKFSGADTLATSYVLAEAIKKIHEDDPIDMIFFGKQAIDGDTAQVGPGVAVRLGYPMVTYAVNIREINLDEGYALIERKTELRNELIKTALPAALTCEKEIAEIPFAALPDLVASLRYKPEVWTAEEPVAYDINQIGLKGSPTMVFKTGTPVQHEPGEVINTTEIGLKEAVDMVFNKMMENTSVAPLIGGKK